MKKLTLLLLVMTLLASCSSYTCPTYSNGTPVERSKEVRF